MNKLLTPQEQEDQYRKAKKNHDNDFLKWMIIVILSIIIIRLIGVLIYGPLPD